MDQAAKIGNWGEMYCKISSMATTLNPVYDYSSVTCNSFSPAPRPLANAYKYDQLNSIVSSKSFANIETLDVLNTFNTWLHSGNYNGMYQNDFTYDANGNIKTQLRKDQVGTPLDNLTYRYHVSGSDVLQNRLYHVNDQAGAVGTDDLPDQGTFNANAGTMNTANNYGYDEIGNLVRDASEDIASISWTASGKMKKLVRTSASTKPDLEFEYDAMGNRISKIVKPDGTSAENGGSDQPLNWAYTYFVRDANGNIMATYEKASSGGTSSYLLKEQPLYGSSRLGIDILEREMIGATVPSSSFEHLLGYRLYEGCNHLGNVLTTFSDIKIPRESTTAGITGYYNTDIRSMSDYYPFGAAMAGRNMSGGYRFGFNSQEKADEISGTGNHNTAFFWEYDTRLGRRWNIDPKPSPSIGNYSCFASNPIIYNDFLGDTTRLFNLKGMALHTINDNLPNQIHFVSDQQYDAVNREFSKKDQEGICYTNNQVAIAMRNNSITYIGKKTFSELQRIRKRGEIEKIGGIIYEQGFKLMIGGTKELVATEIFTENRDGGSIKLQNALEFDTDHLNERIFAVGHTHVKNSESHRSVDLLASYGKPSDSDWSDKADYRPLLKRNNMVISHPLLIVSPFGITIYTPNMNGYYPDYNPKSMVISNMFFK